MDGKNRTGNMIIQSNYMECTNTHENYRIYYTAYGIQDDLPNTLICVHGLGRNNQDYEYIARHFVNLGYYVITPDLIGHGNSSYLNNPSYYSIQGCAGDIMQLITKLKLKNISYIGTSLGGIVGMLLSAIPNSLIQKLILNDIGAEINQQGLRRIASSYTLIQPEYDSYYDIYKDLYYYSQAIGKLPKEVWDKYISSSVQKNINGKYVIKKDVNLALSFEGTMQNDNFSLWDYWLQIQIPTLVIRGENSDILSHDTVIKMKETNKSMQNVEIKATGHAPFLFNTEHLCLLEKFIKPLA